MPIPTPTTGRIPSAVEAVELSKVLTNRLPHRLHEAGSCKRPTVNQIHGQFSGTGCYTPWGGHRRLLEVERCVGSRSTNWEIPVRQGEGTASARRDICKDIRSDL